MRQYLFFFFTVCVIALGCSPNNVKSDQNIVKILDSANLKGCFALMENGSAQFTITDLSMYKEAAAAPLQTYFMLPTLSALDKGYINHDPKSWVNNDSVVYYQAMMQKIGRESLLKMIDSLHYGKGVVSNDLNNFWKDGSLKITPDEQLGLIKRLYFNQLPFQKRSQELYKKMILKEENSNYKLSYLLGSADTSIATNWLLGYVEENKHPYFFVLYVSNQKNQTANNPGVKLIEVVKSILLQQGFLKGMR
jgi:beta-lactamase class D